MIDTQALRAEQLQRASEVIRYDDFQTESPAFIAGADVGFEQEGEVTRAAIAILRYPSLELVEYRVARVATTLPYIPGFYHFVNTLRCSRLGSNCSRSRTWFCRRPWYLTPAPSGRCQPFRSAGRRTDHWRRQKRLCGKFAPLDAATGALAPLEDKGEQLGWVWRSKARCNPLFISTGHRVGADSALAWVQRCMAGYRLPEPTRWADAIASRRPAFQRWLQQHPEVSQ